jgi:hypothetical protein
MPSFIISYFIYGTLWETFKKAYSFRFKMTSSYLPQVERVFGGLQVKMHGGPFPDVFSSRAFLDPSSGTISLTRLVVSNSRHRLPPDPFRPEWLYSSTAKERIGPMHVARTAVYRKADRFWVPNRLNLLFGTYGPDSPEAMAFEVLNQTYERDRSAGVAIHDSGDPGDYGSFWLSKVY